MIAFLFGLSTVLNVLLGIAIACLLAVLNGERDSASKRITDERSGRLSLKADYAELVKQNKELKKNRDDARGTFQAIENALLELDLA